MNDADKSRLRTHTRHRNARGQLARRGREETFEVPHRVGRAHRSAQLYYQASAKPEVASSDDEAAGTPGDDRADLGAAAGDGVGRGQAWAHLGIDGGGIDGGFGEIDEDEPPGMGAGEGDNDGDFVLGVDEPPEEDIPVPFHVIMGEDDGGGEDEVAGALGGVDQKVAILTGDAGSWPKLSWSSVSAWDRQAHHVNRRRRPPRPHVPKAVLVALGLHECISRRQIRSLGPSPLHDSHRHRIPRPRRRPLA